MSKERAAVWGASLGAAMLFATAAFHMTGYRFVVGQAPPDLQPLIAAAWVAGGASLTLAGVLAIAATPLFVVRRAVFLAIAASTPLSIAVLQVVYLGFIPPTALLLFDTAVLLAAGVIAPRAGGGITRS